MNLFDWIALALIVLLAIAGYFRGLLDCRALAGRDHRQARCSARGSPPISSRAAAARATRRSFALGGAIFCAIVFEAFGNYLGSRMRSSMRLKPLRAVDSAGGLLIGAATGLAVVWVLGTVVLLDLRARRTCGGTRRAL